MIRDVLATMSPFQRWVLLPLGGIAIAATYWFASAAAGILA